MIALEVINMRIKLRLNKSTLETIEKELLEKDIEVSEEAALILTEEGYIESIGHDVFIHTNEKKYKTKYRIYQLEGLLPPDRFIRISNSVIIKKNSIRHIKPALSSKFYLTLTNGDVVDVTRTYFYKFKEFYGI